MMTLRTKLLAVVDRTVTHLTALLAVAVIGTTLGGCTYLRTLVSRPEVEEPPPVAVTEPLEGTGRVELLWDTYGVPHIFAQDFAALFYAYGWAQARNHGDLLLRLYGQSRGRAAEYWGPSFVDSDVWVRTNGIPERAESWLAVQPPHILAYLESFVAGVNSYAARHPDSIDAGMRQVLPVTVADIFAHQQRALNYTFLSGPGMAAGAQRALQAQAGSNAWAIAPSRTVGRNALLLANPHLPWGDVFTWFEAHLIAPELDAYGVGLVGMPMIGIAFTPSHGWTHTVNTIDGADLYRLRTSGDYYLFDGEWRDILVEDQVLRVRQPDGTLAERQLRIRSSIHGPIIAERDSTAIALRVAGLETPLLMRQYFDMLRATSLGQFESALAQMQLPLFTVMYADRQGNILHVFNGNVPVRAEGDWTFWRGVVPGETSATLWTQRHDYLGLPRILNPPSGWLQNANDPPWTTTFPVAIQPVFFPPYMAPPPSMSFRAQQSARLLESTGRLSFGDMVLLKHSTRMSAADHFLQDAIIAARAFGDDDARAAADVLERWDRNADAESRGAVLFLHYFEALQRQNWPGGSMFEIAWTLRAPLATPDGLSDPQLAARVLGESARRVRATHGSLDVPWGNVFRIRRDTVDLPASGGPDGAGVFRMLGFQPVSGDSARFIATSGETYIAAIEFSDPVRAQTLLVYGNASQPGSPHRTDQLGLFARKELRTAWLTRDEITRNLKARETF